MKKISLLLCIVSCMVLFSCSKSAKEDPGDNGNPIDVNKPIVVTDIKPKIGGLGTGVIINGENFGNDTSKIEVYFNEKKALLLKVKSNVIYAMVPKQPGDSSQIRVVSKNVSKPAEGLLAHTKFQYVIKASVTTVAGEFNVSEVKDGPALQAHFKRPVMVATTDDGNLFIVDDNGKRLAALSMQDNKVYTISTDFVKPWQCALSSNLSALFVSEQSSGTRPMLFRTVYRADNWTQPISFYDQKDNAGNYIIGSQNIYGLGADDEYVYVITAGAQKLARIHQQSGKVELIGEKLNLPNWNYLAYNKADGKMYIAAEDWGRIYRFDPRHIPPGKQTPWITNADLEWLVGTGVGKPIPGIGTAARLGSLSSIACDGDGNVYTCDYSNDVIWKMDKNLEASIIAGTGTAGYKDGNPKEALFNNPYGICATTDGILYVAEAANMTIRCIAIQ